MKDMIDEKKRVNVYFNLHKKVWSIRQSGKVIKHTDFICLRDVKFRVSKKGRERVLKEQKKNVHAYASGYIISFGDAVPERAPKDARWITYNPYMNDTFVGVDRSTARSSPVLESDTVVMGVKDGRTNVEAFWI